MSVAPARSWIRRHVARDQREQVGGHFRRGGELHLLQARPGLCAGDNRHVRNGGEVFRQHRGKLEAGLEGGFVPARKHGARIGDFELRHQHAACRPRRCLVIVVVNTSRRIRDRAGIINRQRVRSGRDRLREGQGRGLRVVVLRDDRGGARFQLGAGQCQALLIERDGGGRRINMQRDRLMPRQRQFFQIRHDVDRVIVRHHGLGQFAWRVGEIERRLRMGARHGIQAGARHEQGSGYKVRAHGGSCGGSNGNQTALSLNCTIGRISVK